MHALFACFHNEAALDEEHKVVARLGQSVNERIEARIGAVVIAIVQQEFVHDALVVVENFFQDTQIDKIGPKWLDGFREKRKEIKVIRYQRNVKNLSSK